MLDFNTLELWNTRFLTAFTLVWFTALGACIGSFLNVIVWRWPCGRSISRERSECPACGAPIRWFDNLPVVSWLRLRGRCRDCGAAISSRYPCVEVLGAIQILCLLVFEGFSGGTNLPVRIPSSTTDMIWDFWAARFPDLLRILTVHASLWMLANVVWLIDRDGQRLPRTFCLIVTAGGLTVAALFPDVHPELGIVQARGKEVLVEQRVAGFQCSGIGLVAGGTLGILWAWLSGSRTAVVWSSLSALGALTGVVLGWPAMASTVLAAVVLNFLETTCNPWRRFGPVGWWWLALHAQVLLWRSIDAISWWPGRRLPWWGWLGWLAVFLVLAWWSGSNRRQPPIKPASDSAAIVGV